MGSLLKIWFSLAELDTFPGGWGWGAGSSENKANLAQRGLKLGLSLAKVKKVKRVMIVMIVMIVRK